MTGPIITLLTDFGGRDGYVAAMKGVILDLVPNGIVVDASHDIPAQDIQAGAWALSQYAYCYPEKTIHVAVIDPEVGTSRDALIATAGNQIFIAPNNGLLHWVSSSAAGFEVRRIRGDVHRPGDTSSTFHGRDVFAYVAGRLARGLDSIEELSEPVEELVVPNWGEVRSEGGGLVSTVIHVDHFGNLITGIHREHLKQFGKNNIMVVAGDGTLSRLHRTYGDVPAGMPLALIGSHDHLEIAVALGSAREVMGIGRGDRIVVKPKR